MTARPRKPQPQTPNPDPTATEPTEPTVEPEPEKREGLPENYTALEYLEFHWGEDVDEYIRQTSVTQPHRIEAAGIDFLYNMYAAALAELKLNINRLGLTPSGLPEVAIVVRQSVEINEAFAQYWIDKQETTDD